MSAQYDSIAADYQQTKNTPLRRHVEAWSFAKMLGAVKGLRVLDLACGEGYYTRRIQQAGAKEVVGVDISAEMINLAEEQEHRDALGISYHCADATHLPEQGKFDLVSAAYLLHYARNTDELQSMCKQIALQLKPGGRFVAINENPAQENFAGYSQYGFNKSIEDSLREGRAIQYSMLSGRQLIRFEAYYYSSSFYEAALTAAGFSDIEWVPLEVSPDGVDALGEQYWAEYLSNPPVTGLTCRLRA